MRIKACNLFGALLGMVVYGVGISAQASIIDGYVTASTDNRSSFLKLENFSGTVGRNNFNTPLLYGFDELQSVTLNQSLAVDLGNTIAAGTTVESHYIFFDPARSTHLEGQVFFDSEILGVFTRNQSLAFTDSLFALPSVTYLNPHARGLEAARDRVSILDAWTLSVSLQAGSPGDYLRVITLSAAKPTGQPVPEPPIMALLTAGILALAYYRGRTLPFRDTV